MINWLKDLNSFTKVCLIAGFFLILFGYIIRFLSIYFFWESQTFGFGLILIGGVGFFFHQIQEKKVLNKNTILYKIGIGIIVFAILIFSVIWIFVPETNAYKASIRFINENEALINEIGEIKQIVFIPVGGMGMSSGSKEEEGNASLYFIVKGEKAYRDIILHSYTTYDEADWIIYKVE